MALDFNKIREKNGISQPTTANAQTTLDFNSIRAKNGINTQSEIDAYNTLKNATSIKSYVPETVNTQNQNTTIEQPQKWSFYNNVVEPTNAFMSNLTYNAFKPAAKTAYKGIELVKTSPTATVNTATITINENRIKDIDEILDYYQNGNNEYGMKLSKLPAYKKYSVENLQEIRNSLSGKTTEAKQYNETRQQQAQEKTDTAFKNFEDKTGFTESASTKAGKLGQTAGNVVNYLATSSLLGGTPAAYGVTSGLQTFGNTSDTGDVLFDTAKGYAFGKLSSGITKGISNSAAKYIPSTTTNIVSNVLKNALAGGTGMYGAGAITGEASNIYNKLRNREITGEDWLKPIWSDEALSNFVVGSIFGAYTGTKTDLANAEAKLKSDYNSLGAELNQKNLQIKDALTKGDLATAQRLTQEGNELISNFANTKYLGYKLNENGANMLNQLWQDNVLKSSVLYNPTTIGNGAVQTTNIQQQTANLPSTNVAPQQKIQSLDKKQYNIPSQNKTTDISDNIKTIADYIKQQAISMIDDLNNMKKVKGTGNRITINPILEGAIDFSGKDYNEIRNALTEIKNNPSKRIESEVGQYIKKSIEVEFEDIQYENMMNSLDENKNVIEQPIENKTYTTEEAIKIGLDNAKLKREYERVKKLAENNPEQYKQALSDMKKTIDSNNKIINARKKEIKSAKLNTAKEFIKNGTEWKDKKTGIQYSTETAERNIYDVVGNNEKAKKIINTYIKPIYKDTKIITDAKNNYSKSVKELDLNTKEIYDTSDIIAGKIKKAVKDVEYEPQKKLSESSLVQLLGEKIINKKDIEDLGADYNKIQKSVTSIKKIYNDLYEQINNSLVENGYDPVEYTKDYFPHFEEDKPETIIQKIASKLGISAGDDALPTEIAGKTQIFKPGKKWMANLLTRTGNKTYYDAVKGLDRYVNNALEVIHHTKDIQNLRALSNALRYQYSDKAVQERVDEIQNNDSLSDIQKSELIKQEYQTNNSTLSRFTQWLERYTNDLAGKKSDLDREIEYQINRNIYKNFKSIEGRIASNMVGGNISSAFTNFIPITQASAEISPKYLLQGAKDTISNFKNSIEGTNELINNSAFLTNRRGSEAIYEETSDKINKALGSLMEGIDNFTSESIVRARFYQNINEGMNEQEALDEADDFARGLMAGRSTGEMPLIAKASNPLVKLLTSFQLEVNNQYRYFAKDLPRHIKEKLDKEDIKDANKYKTKYISKLTSGIFSAAIFAYLFNNLYEKVFGRRAATDPISTAQNLAEDTKAKGLKTALTNVSKDVAEEIPFVGGLIGGGRIPISSAIPSLTNTFSSVLKLYDEEEENNKQAKETLKKELSKPLYYLLPPTGGGQLKKTVEGISTLAKGGEYSYDSSGNKKLNYEIDWESLTPAQKFGKATQSIIAGKSATKEAQNYYKNGGLSASKTEKYEDAKEAGINYDQFVNIYNDLSSIKPKKTNKEGKEEVNTNARKQQIKEYLDNTNLTEEQKKIMYGMFYEIK